jgi:Domain of unknown function (DUF4265)
MREDDVLTKICVMFYHHPSHATGEWMWARPLGNDLYELVDVPFLCYGLNYGDVVWAKAKRRALAPEIGFVVECSGHTTLRVFFSTLVPRRRRLALVRSLAPSSMSSAEGNRTDFALDFAPDADLEAIHDRLAEWAAEGWADFETCEARVPGSFDARPREYAH